MLAEAADVKPEVLATSIVVRKCESFKACRYVSTTNSELCGGILEGREHEGTLLVMTLELPPDRVRLGTSIKRGVVGRLHVGRAVLRVYAE